MNKQNIFQLDSCVWEITLACCFSCKYCGSGAGKARRDELNTYECINIANQLAKLGCRRVSLIGGEVFMRSDWEQVVDTLVQKNIQVSVITNGFMVDESIVRKLASLGVESVAISIDGPREIHDKYRQIGSYNKAIDALNLLIRKGVEASIITTLHSGNVNQLERLYDEIKSLGIFAWQLQACSPMGNAIKGDIDSRINFEDIIDFVANHAPKSNFRLGIADNIGYYSGLKGEIRINSGVSFFGGCSAGLRSIGIDSVGNVRGCESLYDDLYIEGNLLNSTLEEIWNDPNAFAYNRAFSVDKLTGKCKGCELGKICAGGCRSYNYFSNGHIYESSNCIRSKRK